MRRAIFIGAIATLFVAFLPVSAASAAAPGDVLVATGTVRDSAGQPIAGEMVTLYAWPSDQVLSGLQAGATVPTTLLATTTTNSAGQYSLYVAPAALQAVAVSGPNANLEVDPGTGKPWSFVTDTSSPVATKANLKIRRSQAVLAAPGLRKSPDVTGCTWVYQHQLNREWASVGSTYIWHESPGVTGTFDYNNTQSSTLGMGFSVSGAYGTFSADGTNSESSTTTVGFPQGGSGNFWEYQTEFRTALYGHACSPGGIDGYRVRTNGWVGGQNIVYETSAPSTHAAYCAPYLAGPGSFFQTSNEDAITWNGSLGLTFGEVGFQGTAQTGYDTNAQLTYDFSKATQTNYVCGTNTYGPQAWRTVVQSHT